MVNARVPYADPGYTSGGRIPLLPLDTHVNVMAAWELCKTTTDYTDTQLTRIKAAIEAAASRLRIDLGAQ